MKENIYFHPPSPPFRFPGAFGHQLKGLWHCFEKLLALNVDLVGGECSFSIFDAIGTVPILERPQEDFQINSH